MHNAAAASQRVCGPQSASLAHCAHESLGVHDGNVAQRGVALEKSSMHTEPSPFFTT
jgi:hypothetical protein